MREQGIFPVSEVRHFRRLPAAFVSAEARLNVHHNDGRKFRREIQGYAAVNFLFRGFVSPVRPSNRLHHLGVPIYCLALWRRETRPA